MCRLLAYASPTPTTFVQAVGAVESADFQRLARLHGDGWGALWNRDAPFRPSLTRFRAHFDGYDDTALTHALSGCAARAGLAHLRMATAGLPVAVGNTHPFMDGTLGMAHNGSITCREVLRSWLSADSCNRLTGTTDSELYFALVRERVRDGDTLTGAVTTVVEAIGALEPQASLNAVFLSPYELVVVRSSTHAPAPIEHFLARGVPLTELPLHHADEYYRMSMRRGPDGGIVVASSGLDTCGWEELPTDSLTHVDLKTLAVTTTPLLRITSPTRFDVVA